MIDQDARCACLSTVFSMTAEIGEGGVFRIRSTDCEFGTPEPLPSLRLRSSSATADTITTTALPNGPPVSRLSRNDTNSMPRWFSVSSTSRKCRTLPKVYELKIRIH
jgi:hypothetical protein